MRSRIRSGPDGLPAAMCWTRRPASRRSPALSRSRRWRRQRSGPKTLAKAAFLSGPAHGLGVLTGLLLANRLARGNAKKLGAGTDAAQPWMRATLLVTGIPIVCLFLLRILPADAPERIDVPRSHPPGTSDIEVSDGSQKVAPLWAHGLSRAQQARGDGRGDDHGVPQQQAQPPLQSGTS